MCAQPFPPTPVDMPSSLPSDAGEPLAGLVFLVADRHKLEAHIPSMLREMGARVVRDLSEDEADLPRSRLYEVAELQKKVTRTERNTYRATPVSPRWVEHQYRTRSDGFLEPETSPIFGPYPSGHGIRAMRDAVVVLDNLSELEWQYARELLDVSGATMGEELAVETTHVCGRAEASVPPAGTLVGDAVLRNASALAAGDPAPIQVLDWAWLHGCVYEWRRLPPDGFELLTHSDVYGQVRRRDTSSRDTAPPHRRERAAATGSSDGGAADAAVDGPAAGREGGGPLAPSTAASGPSDHSDDGDVSSPEEEDDDDDGDASDAPATATAGGAAGATGARAASGVGAAAGATPSPAVEAPAAANSFLPGRSSQPPDGHTAARDGSSARAQKRTKRPMAPSADRLEGGAAPVPRRAKLTGTGKGTGSGVAGGARRDADGKEGEAGRRRATVRVDSSSDEEAALAAKKAKGATAATAATAPPPVVSGALHRPSAVPPSAAPRKASSSQGERPPAVARPPATRRSPEPGRFEPREHSTSEDEAQAVGSATRPSAAAEEGASAADGRSAAAASPASQLGAASSGNAAVSKGAAGADTTQWRTDGHVFVGRRVRRFPPRAAADRAHVDGTLEAWRERHAGAKGGGQITEWSMRGDGDAPAVVLDHELALEALAAYERDLSASLHEQHAGWCDEMASPLRWHTGEWLTYISFEDEPMSHVAQRARVTIRELLRLNKRRVGKNWKNVTSNARLRGKTVVQLPLHLLQATHVSDEQEPLTCELCHQPTVTCLSCEQCDWDVCELCRRALRRAGPFGLERVQCNRDVELAQRFGEARLAGGDAAAIALMTSAGIEQVGVETSSSRKGSREAPNAAKAVAKEGRAEEAPSAAAREAAPKETAPKETAPKETAPMEAAPKETAPKETAPMETAPMEVAARETAPMEAAATESAAAEAAPMATPEQGVAEAALMEVVEGGADAAEGGAEGMAAGDAEGGSAGMAERPAGLMDDAMPDADGHEPDGDVIDVLSSGPGMASGPSPVISPVPIADTTNRIEPPRSSFAGRSPRGDIERALSIAADDVIPPAGSEDEGGRSGGSLPVAGSVLPVASGPAGVGEGSSEAARRAHTSGGDGCASVGGESIAGGDVSSGRNSRARSSEAVGMAASPSSGVLLPAPKGTAEEHTPTVTSTDPSSAEPSPVESSQIALSAQSGRLSGPGAKRRGSGPRSTLRARSMLRAHGRSEGQPLGTSTVPPPVIQLVGGSEEAGRRVRSAIHTLGAELIEGATFDSRCTHVVAIELKRSEKALCALAAGCWLVNFSWVDASLDAEGWLPEEPYEVFESGDEASVSFGKGTLWMGAPRASRLRREGIADGEALVLAFSGHSFLVAADIKQPPSETIRRILQAGGAEVLNADQIPLQPNDATVIVLPQGAPCDHSLACLGQQHSLACVPPEFVIDQLTLRNPQGVDAYRVCR